MAKAINWRSAHAVEKKTAPGNYRDGLGLYLHVAKFSARNGLFRHVLNGKVQWMGLGSCHDVSFAAARDAQHALLNGADRVDPIAARNINRTRDLMPAAKTTTFDKCADTDIEVHRTGRRNAKRCTQWTAILKTYASPKFGTLPMQAIATAMVMEVLAPLWRTKIKNIPRLATEARPQALR